MKTFLILYVPVIHSGYLDVINKHLSVDRLYLLDQSFVRELSGHVEIRSLSDVQAYQILNRIIPDKVEILDSEELDWVQKDKTARFITADEALTRKFMETYLPGREVTFVTTFLRWEESKVLSQTNVPYDRISTDEKDREHIELAGANGNKSSDWWRHVGAVLVTSCGATFQGHNTHVPTEYAPYINGDPRDSIKAGTMSEYSSALHAEKSVFAQALRLGVSTENASLYTTTFPCPDCAKLVAYSGVKRVFFKGGHASLDGAHVLKAKGVEIIKVE